MNSQLQNQKKDKEGFENNQGLVSIYPIAHAVVGMFALYLSFKCNNGFNLIDFLIACCCPWIYVIYRFATGLCNREN